MRFVAIDRVGARMQEASKPRRDPAAQLSAAHARRGQLQACAGTESAAGRGGAFLAGRGAPFRNRAGDEADFRECDQIERSAREQPGARGDEDVDRSAARC